MVRLLVLALLVTGALAHAGHDHSHDHDPSEKIPGVVDVTPDNVASVVNGAKSVLLEVYAPWCGHCKQLAPVYSELAAEVMKDKDLSARVIIAKANADEHRELAEKFGVRGFPTIKYIPRGKLAEGADDYNGGRTKDDFLSFLKTRDAAARDAVSIDALAPLAKKFFAAKKADLQSIADEARAAVDALASDDAYKGKMAAAQAHAALLAKAAEKGTVKFFQTERERLERVLASGSVTAAKLEAMALKADVLGTILEAK